MANTDLELLKTFELRLLRCSLPPPHPNTSLPPSEFLSKSKRKPLFEHIETVLLAIEEGNYAKALSSEAARLVFPFAEPWDFQDSEETADRFYTEVEKSVALFVQNDSEAWLNVLGDEDDSETSCRAFLVMSIGVAAFLAFTQSSVTGPIQNYPAIPITVLRWKADGVVSCAKGWDMWARRQLMLCGSDLLGKFSLLQYIVFGKILLVKIKDLCNMRRDSCCIGTRTISWWLCRLLFFQQKILEERSSSLFDQLQVLMRETILHFGQLDKVTSYWGTNVSDKEASALASMTSLEAGIIEHVFGRVDSSRQFFICSEEACGLHLSVTGVLGFRTVHQVDAKAQLVLVATSEQNSSNEIITRVQDCTSNYGEDSTDSDSQEKDNNCDILMAPKLLGDSGNNGNVSHNYGSAKMVLNGVQQAVVLAQCLLLKEGERDDELQRWRMAPFIEAIDAQHFSFFTIKCFCNILRIRWESTRSRTKERALLMMDELVQRICESIPGATQRIYFCYGVYLPSISAMRKEYGELLVSCGLIGDALKIFEDLELWDNLIYCYRLLGKKPAAVDLIKTRLVDTPNDPRLWCSLGDVTNDDSFYEKALEVSNRRFARAKRSLARSAYNRGDYETSKLLWESAMAANSLYPDGWFALGAAALKARDVDKAVDAFTRTVQLDPDNGEAWNNIACLHKIRKKNKEAFIAFKEALKFRRTSWQMWENYSEVAMDIGNFSQALEATKTVLDLTNNKRIDTDLLERLMVEMEARNCRPSLLPTGAEEDAKSSVQNCSADCPSDSIDTLRFSNSGTALERETEQLMDLLGKVLQQIVRSGGGGDIWGLYARWLRVKGDLLMSSEALMKQVRSYQGSDLWHNQDRFKKFVHASLQLCKAYMDIASSTGSRRELGQAEMHLRNTIKQAEKFSDMEEYRDLQACYDEVKKQIQVASSENA